MHKKKRVSSEMNGQVCCCEWELCRIYSTTGRQSYSRPAGGAVLISGLVVHETCDFSFQAERKKLRLCYVTFCSKLERMKYCCARFTDA